MCGHLALQINKLCSCQSRYLLAHAVPTWEELLPEIMLLRSLNPVLGVPVTGSSFAFIYGLEE